MKRNVNKLKALLHFLLYKLTISSIDKKKSKRKEKAEEHSLCKNLSQNLYDFMFSK